MLLSVYFFGTVFTIDAWLNQERPHSASQVYDRAGDPRKHSSHIRREQFKPRL